MTQTSAQVGSKVVIRSAVPTILVADVAATARWYAANLGAFGGAY